MNVEIKYLSEAPNQPENENVEQRRERITALFGLFCDQVRQLASDEAKDEAIDYVESVDLSFVCLDEALPANLLEELIGLMRDELGDYLEDHPEDHQKVEKVIDEFEALVLPPKQEKKKKELSPEEMRIARAKKYYEELRLIGVTIPEIADAMGYGLESVRNYYGRPQGASDSFLSNMEKAYPFLAGEADRPLNRLIDFPLDDFYAQFVNTATVQNRHLNKCFFWNVRGDQFIKILGSPESDNFKTFIKNLNEVFDALGGLKDVARQIDHPTKALRPILSGKSSFSLQFIYALLQRYADQIDHHQLFKGIPEVYELLGVTLDLAGEQKTPEKIREEKLERYFKSLRNYGITLSEIAEKANYTLVTIQRKFASPKAANDTIVARIEEAYPFLRGQGEVPDKREIKYPLDDFYIEFMGDGKFHFKRLKYFYFWGMSEAKLMRIIGEHGSENHTKFIDQLNEQLKPFGGIKAINKVVDLRKDVLRGALSKSTGITSWTIYELLKHYGNQIDHHALFKGIPEVLELLPEKEGVSDEVDND